jgi:hypothetical protein
LGKLNTTHDNIEIQTNKVVSLSSASAAHYPTASTVTSVYESTLNTYMPIGTILETSDSSWSPNSRQMGTWQLVESGEICEHVGSQVLYPGINSGGQVGKTNLSCCYHDMLFEQLYTTTTKPGYHVEFRLSFIATTAGDRNIEVFLNTLRVLQGGTYSHANYRICFLSNRFKLSDIKKETTTGYSTEGINLDYLTTQTTNASNGGAWAFYDICIHAYLVSDEPVYRWKRVS